MSHLLHTPREVLTLRHAPSWLTLAAAAGAVNGGAFLLSERFVSHLTGTVTRLGLTFAFDALLALAAFLAGAMTSALLVQRPAAHGRAPRHAEAMVLAAALVGVVGAAGGHEGWASFDHESVGLVCALAFAMGLLNATVASGTGALVRPTHLTGTATDLGVNLATALWGASEARQEAARWAALRAGTLGAFALGGLSMVPLTALGGHAAFGVPAALIVFAALASFRSAPVVPSVAPGARP